MRNPLLAPFAALACGVLAARFVPFEVRELLYAIGALVALAVLAAWKRARIARAAAMLTALALAGALSGVRHQPGARPEVDAGARELVTVEGCVVEPVIFSEDRAQFTLELERHARARVSLYEKPGERAPDLRYGQKVELDGHIRATHNFRNPGAFDNATYLARQDVYWNASARAGAVRVRPGRCGSGFWKLIFDLRGAALAHLAELYRGDAYRTGMMQAILIGETTNLDKIWTEHFRRTGTYHALVISGLHVTVLAGTFLFLLRICMVPEPPALAATMLAAWLYALVSGWSAPAVRAAAGFTLFVVARYVFRRPRLMNILAAIAAAFVALDPAQLFDASFQLSFLSVAAIGALAVPVLDRTSAPLVRGLPDLGNVDRDLHMKPRTASFRVELRLAAETLSLWTRLSARTCLAVLGVGFRVLFWVYEMVVISAIVQFGLALPMAAYFHRLSITGLTANLFVVPLMTAAVPVGFAAIFTGWKFIATLAGWLLAASEWVAAWHVRWEPDWRIPDPPLWLALLFVASLLALSFFRRWKPAVWAALAISVLSLAVLVWHPFPPLVRRGTFEMTAMDVGQGDGLFLAYPDGKLMMLDAGGIEMHGTKRRPRLDIGEDVVSPYLWTRSIRRLDAIAMSHPHQDHIGGLPAVVANFHPREIWMGPVAETPEWQRLRAEVERCGVRIVHLEAGMRFHYGGTDVEVLAPEHGHEPSEKAPNDDSVVLRITYGRHSFLLCGDIEKQVEGELAFENLSHADVLKVPHHGSRTSSTDPFVDLVYPAFAIMSAGFENSYGLPHAAVIRRYEQRQTQVLRTDEQGLISFSSDGRHLRFDTPDWPHPSSQIY